MSTFRPGSFQILPPVVKNLIIINCLMVLLQFVVANFGIDLADYLGLHYWRSPLYRPWQLLTHMFMHGSALSVNVTITHLFFNMFALWMFGSVLENVWGPKRFLLFYLVCGLGAAVLHLGVLGYQYNLFQQAFIRYQQNAELDQYILFIQQNGVDHIRAFSALQSFWEKNPACSNCSYESVTLIQQYYSMMIDEATVGASGAVFGVLFAFGYLFPNTLLYIYFLFPVKAKYVIGVYILIELWAGIRNSAGDNVAHFAHLGGMLVAFILLRIWKKRETRNRMY